MRLAIISHKVCWKSPDSSGDYVTDGGFPRQVRAISELFSETAVIIPRENSNPGNGVSTLTGHNLTVHPLDVPKSTGLRRKIGFPFWMIRNSRQIWAGIRNADAVHAPIPGDIGTIGILYSLLLRKPLFVRHCGNWLIQRTVAERFWKWGMEYFAGGRNVMFATGGSTAAPSERNSNIKWIFSTSLTNGDLENAESKTFPKNDELRLITACRLEERKGVDVVIACLPAVLEHFPKAHLDIVGDGSLSKKLKELAKTLKVEDRVTFHGKVKHEKVTDLMKQSHLFCFPTTASEGFPKVVLEALSCGLPVITTNVSVLPSLIREGCGVLLEEATSDCLAKAITSVGSSPREFEIMSGVAVATAKKYSLEKWKDFIGENLRRAWKANSLSSVS